jgi:uncharacterized repeat protein (TIGR01451 family)
VLLGALVLALGVPAVAAHASAANLTITPTTWNVIGLDSNRETDGPARYPVGVRICNTGTTTATNVTSAFTWDSSNAYLSLVGSASQTHGDLAGSACSEVEYEVDVQRAAAAKDTARRFHVTASADGVSSVSTPTPRELYIESLVSQGRNNVDGITGAGGLGTPAPTSVLVGQSYTYQLFSSTSTTYPQLATFLNFPTTIFRLDSIGQTYTNPAGTTSSGIYVDACGFQINPTLANYRKCVGPEGVAGGKVGGDIVTTYHVTVVGAGTAQLSGMVLDFSGSSFHYNSDFGVGVNSLTVTATNPPPVTADLSMTASAAPDPGVVGSNVTDTFTVTNGSATTTAQSVVLTDVVPAGAAYVSATPSQGSCSFSSGTVTCNLGGLAGGASASVAIVVTPSAAGTLSNQATVASSTSDPNNGNNQATASSQVNNPAPPGAPDLVVTEVATPDPANISQPLTFRFTVRNVGTAGATGVTLVDPLPGTMQFVSATPSVGSCFEAAGIVTCDLGDLAAGDFITVDIVVIPWVLGPASDGASVSSNEVDANPNDNADSADVRVGFTCTIVGTNAPDVIYGTAGNDVICGLWGRDRIYGMGGDDVLYGDWNSDVIYGGDGNDMLWGKAGRDHMYGDAGSDVLKGGYNNDTLDSRDDVEANDSMDGGKGRDVFLGDSGDRQYDSRDN